MFSHFFSDVTHSLKQTDDHVCQNESDTTYSNLLHYFQIPDKMPLEAIDWNNLSALSLYNYKESILDDYDLRILLDIYKT